MKKVIEHRSSISSIIQRATEFTETGDWVIEKALHVSCGFWGLGRPRYRVILRPATPDEKQRHIDFERLFAERLKLAMNPIAMARAIAERLGARNE